MQPHELIQYIDLTSLNQNDTIATVEKLCEKAITPYGKVAAICVYGKFIAPLKTYLNGQGISLATVANFPSGMQSLTETLREVEEYLTAGTDEIDVVIDYRQFLAGKKNIIQSLVRACKSLCVSKILKVILETGELKEKQWIDYASRSALDAGADFLKTSTGKVPVNATIAAAETMLQAIAELNPAAGFKAAGGIKTPPEAMAYVTLARTLLGEAWMTPEHFRLGASTLLDNILLQQERE